jgi:hypothetical protein
MDHLPHDVLLRTFAAVVSATLLEGGRFVSAAARENATARGVPMT